jgi:quinol monooxygenase YgiN
LILVTGHLRVPPDKVEALRPHMRNVIEATRNEDGCILYAFAEDVLDPGMIRIVERWRDWPSLDAHGKAAHIAAWSAVVKDKGGVLSREVIAHAAGEERIL